VRDTGWAIMDVPEHLQEEVRQMLKNSEYQAVH
jgi:hypothetical protein